jgi:hypothetical protein
MYLSVLNMWICTASRSWQSGCGRGHAKAEKVQPLNWITNFPGQALIAFVDYKNN